MLSDDIDNVYSIEIAGHRSPWTREILRDCVLVNYDCRVIELDSDAGRVIAGYIICRYVAGSCHILNLCITPRLQGNNYGQLLLQNVIDFPKHSPIDTVYLEVRPSNSAAMHLYKKMGFLQTGTKVAYYQEEEGVEDAVVLQKKIIS